MKDEVLHGGFLTNVVRRGGMVRRPVGPWTPAVHAFLLHLHGRGFDACPTVVAVEEGVEVLTYLPGEVLRYPPSGWFWEPAMPARLGELLRELHNAGSGFHLPDGLTWAPARPPEGPAEVICHGDFSPTNVLFTDGVPRFVIDFDFAAPGPRVWDVASALYRAAPLHAPALFEQWGLPVPDLDTQFVRAREFLRGYGAASETTREVLGALEAQLLRHIHLIRTGGAAFAVQRQEQHDEAYAIDLGWLGRIGKHLEAELQSDSACGGGQVT